MTGDSENRKHFIIHWTLHKSAKNASGDGSNWLYHTWTDLHILPLIRRCQVGPPPRCEVLRQIDSRSTPYVPVDSNICWSHLRDQVGQLNYCQGPSEQAHLRPSPLTLFQWRLLTRSLSGAVSDLHAGYLVGLETLWCLMLFEASA